MLAPLRTLVKEIHNKIQFIILDYFLPVFSLKCLYPQMPDNSIKEISKAQSRYFPLCYFYVRPKREWWVFKYSGTSVLVVNSLWNSWQVPKPMRTAWWSICSRGAASWLIQVLASDTSPNQAPSAETFFSRQNVTSTGFDEVWSHRVRGVTVSRKGDFNLYSSH